MARNLCRWELSRCKTDQGRSRIVQGGCKACCWYWLLDSLCLTAASHDGNSVSCFQGTPELWQDQLCAWAKNSREDWYKWRHTPQQHRVDDAIQLRLPRYVQRSAWSVKVWATSTQSPSALVLQLFASWHLKASVIEDVSLLQGRLHWSSYWYYQKYVAWSTWIHS